VKELGISVKERETEMECIQKEPRSSIHSISSMISRFFGSGSMDGDMNNRSRSIDECLDRESGLNRAFNQTTIVVLGAFSLFDSMPLEVIS
jgi:hypothetical protein